MSCCRYPRCACNLPRPGRCSRLRVASRAHQVVYGFCCGETIIDTLAALRALSRTCWSDKKKAGLIPVLKAIEVNPIGYQNTFETHRIHEKFRLARTEVSTVPVRGFFRWIAALTLSLATISLAQTAATASPDSHPGNICGPQEYCARTD